MPPPGGGGGATPQTQTSAGGSNGLGNYHLGFAQPPPPQTATGGAVPPSSSQDDMTGDLSGSSSYTSPIYITTPRIGIGSLSPGGGNGWGFSFQGLAQQYMNNSWSQQCTANNGNRGGGSYTYNSMTSRGTNYGVCIGVGYFWEDAQRDVQYGVAAYVDLMQDMAGDWDIPAASLGFMMSF